MTSEPRLPPYPGPKLKPRVNYSTITPEQIAAEFAARHDCGCAGCHLGRHGREAEALEIIRAERVGHAALMGAARALKCANEDRWERTCPKDIAGREDLWCAPCKAIAALDKAGVVL